MTQTQTTQTTARERVADARRATMRPGPPARPAAQHPARPAVSRAARLAAGRTRRELRRDAAALYRAADIVAARGDGNEAARVRGVADDYARAIRYGRLI